MSQVDRLRRQLESARNMSLKLLSDFKSPQEWTQQVHPQSNHALWFAGHMATTDNFFISIVAPEQAKDLGSFQTLFGMGSEPTSDASAYPAPGEVLDVMAERRATLLAVLANLTEADLAQPTSPGTPAFLPDIASIFETAIWHEGMHSGQLTVARRALGHQPVMG
jgi:uncharacterized damage-inducible protein DinB